MSGHSQLVIFTVIFLMYSLTVLGNVIIISLICLISHLHTPMYFFLCNLSVQDIIYVSDTLPKFLAITQSGDDTITFPACFTQLFIFVFCIGTEFFLLTSMAYDRYIAICVPLHYAVVMKKIVCILLAAASWFVGFLNALTQSLILSRAEFCHSHNINHFYCDLKIMIKLASSDTSIIQKYLLAIIVVLGFLPFVLILTSYICIISTIAKIRSSEGRVKAFSCCSSHVTTVILFYGGVLGTYTVLESEHSQEQEKLLALLYTALVPFLNPLVYTLRNKEVLRAMMHVKEKYLRFWILT
ncbi:PREDICTED: olfactory receptor 5V1-like [Nanorana parkeri]|uniref:olfactory receptor 5V1-like n=1 Tax=Nanorana parkeri TaxID=125878 RepID=UPI000854A19E|nr:PREDICTED: olfactory receptor 5V1-like [Nanorana parkeri]